MIEKIENLKSELQSLTASNTGEVEQLRIKYLSKKGLVTSLFSEFRNVPAEQKKELGQRLNELKTLAADRITSCASRCQAARTTTSVT